MIKNLTIGKKIGYGFGFVMLCLAAVSTMSYIGVGGIVNDAGQVITGNKLDGRLALNEVDHLNWANQVGALLTDDAVTKLDVQTDDHLCGFGKWLYGDERKAAEAAVPSIAPLLKEIEQYHADLHASATEIGKAFRQPHTGLIEQLSDNCNDHVAWVGQCSHGLALEGSLYAYQNRVRNVVDEAMSLIQMCAADESLGDEDTRQTKAKELIRALRYGPESKDYLWINDTHPTMVMHPYKPQLEGEDLSESVDPNGKKLFIEMVKACAGDGAGFVTYQWPFPGTDALTPKISYVKLYKPWGWIVGTGVFVTEDNQRFLARLDEFAAGKPYTLGVQTDPTKCAFGQFLADPATQRLCDEFPEFATAIQAIKQPHEHLHALGKQIETLVTAGDMSTALSVYEKQILPTLTELKQQFQTAIVAEQQLREGSNQANQIFATKTKPNLEKVQSLLGKIRQEIRANVITDDAMLAAAQFSKQNVTLVGGVAIIIGALLAFFISRGIVKTLTRVIVGLNEGAEQVNDAATQVSSASQQLAEGASEQASSLEETSSALEQVAAQTRTNAENSGKANDLAAQARNNAQAGDKTMSQLNAAMSAINESSNEISKIIKVIEEIAFQTNLLALNAAVEAARAGEHGKGFAVVAEEVRNLAQRSAQAARDTTALIEGSVTRAKEGSTVANSAGTALQSIVSDVAQVADLLNGITQASQEQSQGVDQVNTAVTQMDKVTQQNAAGAEESASAAEQLSAQAQTVKGMVDELAALVGASKTTAQYPAPTTKGRQLDNYKGSTNSQHHDPTQAPHGHKTNSQDSMSFDVGDLKDF